MSILVFLQSLSGHNLEYFHHLYSLAVTDGANVYSFLVPQDFSKKRSMFDWPEADNVRIIQYEKELQCASGDSLIRLFIHSLRVNIFLCKYIKLLCTDKVFLVSIMPTVPFAPLLIPSKVRLSGIIYSDYLWNKDNLRPLARLVNWMKYFIFSLPVFENVFMLNDEKGANFFNTRYKTNKFRFLPDPHIYFEIPPAKSIREQYGITEDKIIFSHFGSLSSYKSSCLILKSLRLLSEEQRKKYVFIFAGKVQEGIKKEFYSLYGEVKDCVNVILEDSFCEFDYFAMLARDSNAILIPYQRSTQSSGIIGYASQYNTPVIGPSDGLLGELIQRYGLGYCLENISAEALVESYSLIENGSILAPDDKYCRDNTVEKFLDVIRFGVLNNR